MIFAPSLDRLASVGISDFTEQQAIRKEWSEVFASDFGHFDTFYDLIVNAGQTLLDIEPSFRHSHAFSHHSAEVFLYTASDAGYLLTIGSKPAIEERLARHNETILSLIAQMTAAAKHRQDLAVAVDALMSLYFYHVSYGDVAKGLYADIGRIIPEMVMTFPAHSFPFALSLLSHGADTAERISRIMIFHVVDRGDVAHNLCQAVAEGTIDLHRDRKWLRELGPAIMGPVARAVRDERPEICDAFVSAFVLTPLHCNPQSHEEQIERLETDLSILRARLKSFERWLKAPTPVTAQDTSLVLDISEKKEELERVKNDFEAWTEERWDFAVRQVATRPDNRATLEAIQTRLSPLLNADLEQLLSDAAQVTPDKG
ncbi:hypothetical protein ANTHELSMS3_02891 [Antarctobacter heliothermus]|uniref:Uncharacterized protein n=1 Tax=Antarctobacter heliothermus TaxID=74033 RepID=A0A222E5R7_9RHOB|nr:hypothetical protein [Antarctobacter heliothermus]ASP21545.1 hypothetical protein ANTHELSMS3_02891 [Antarctobacter heliothermus]